MRKKLLLIQPVSNAFRDNKEQFLLSEPLALQILAGLTPMDKWEIKIIDERMEEETDILNYEEADLVGLTAYTCSAPRAYKIAESYKKKGIPVIMGGIHASMMPNEALDYVDTVVTGEAEKIWGKVLEDFENKEMQRVYNGGISDLNEMPQMRRDALPSHYKPFYSIQTGRGCPHDCDFCSVTRFCGFRRRKYPLEEVLDAFEAIPNNIVLFADDNLVGYSKKDKEYAINLFKGIIERGIKKMWYTQTSFHIAQDEVLEYAAKSGCKIILIGIESENPKALKEMNKTLNLKVIGTTKYDDLYSIIHRHGIIINGSFIYGLDADTGDDLRRRTDYIINSNLDIARTNVITPLPGTRLFERMRKENRLLYINFPDDWELYNLENVIVKPALMTPDELNERFQESKELIYSNEVANDKYKKTLKNSDEFTAFILKSNYLECRRHYLQN